MRPAALLILSVNCSENRTWIEVFFEGDLVHPKTVKAGEFLRGKTLDQTIAKKAGEMAREGAKPLKDNGPGSDSARIAGIGIVARLAPVLNRACI